jgi:serine protease Do
MTDIFRILDRCFYAPLALCLLLPCICEADEQTELQVGPRALSRAFRHAARDATPSVVTILSFGQNIEEQAGNDQSSNQSDDESADKDEQTEDSDPKDDEGEEQAIPGESVPGEPVPSPLQTDNGTLQITGLGSGVILSADGRIITNHHVIAGAKKVIVQLQDQTEFEAYDIHSDTDSDVATLRVRPTDVIVPATLGDSDSLEIGDWVLAIGSPFKLEATVSAGIISAKNRAIAKISRGRLLQTDAAINPGNSGGPLVDLDGHVVAISTAIATRNGGYQGIGFAIPINQAKWIADELSQHGKVRRAAIGIRVADLNKKVASKFNLQVGIGVLVHQVIEGSAAAKANIKPLDVITDIAGNPVRRGTDVQEIVERLPVGSTQIFKVLRDGETVELQVQLAPIEDPTDVASDDSSNQDETDADAKKEVDSDDVDKPSNEASESETDKPVDETR